MAGIRNQRNGVRQKSKSALDDHEDHIESHGNAHSKIDAAGRYQRMPVSAMIMAMAMRVIVIDVIDVIMIGVVMIVSVIMCDLVFVFHRV